MPRTVSSALQAHLECESPSLAVCVKIVRRDGVTLGFTGADRDLTFDAVLYKHADGLLPSAMRSGTMLPSHVRTPLRGFALP